MKTRHNDSSASCSCTSCLSKSGSATSLKRIIRVGSRANKLQYGSNIPAKERKLLDKLVATRAEYNKLRADIISSSEQEDRSLRRDDAEGPNVLELVRLVDKGGALGHNELAECCSCCICDPLMARHTHTKKQRHGHAGRARAGRADYSSRSSVTPRLKEPRQHVRFKAKYVHSDPCTCTTKLSAVFKKQSKEMVSKLLNQEKQKSMPPESFANKRNKRPVQKYLQKIKHSETKMEKAIQDGARRSLKKLKQSKSKLLDRQHYEISTELIRTARDSIKRQEQGGSKSSEELEAMLSKDKINLNRKMKNESRNTSKKISKLVQESKMKLKQNVEVLVRKSAEKIQELEAKRKLGKHMCECPGIQAELTRMAKRNLSKHKSIPGEMLDFDKDIQEPKVNFNRRVTNEIRKSARKVADVVQESQAKLRENVEVLAQKSVEKIKQLDAQRKLLQKTVCECPEIKAEVINMAKQSLNRRKQQPETSPDVENIGKPLKYNPKGNAALQSSKEKINAMTDAVKESATKFRKLVSDKLKADDSEVNIEDTKRFKIRKDSKTKYREALVKKKALKEWECEAPCFPEECIPQECYEKIVIRKAKLAEMRNISRLSDKEMAKKSLSDLNTQLDAVKKSLNAQNKIHRLKSKKNRAVKPIKYLSKTSGVGVEANQLENREANVKKKALKDWECEEPCLPEECIPKNCYEKKANLAEFLNIGRLSDTQMVKKSLSYLNTRLDAGKKRLNAHNKLRSERKKNRAVKPIKVISKTSDVGVKVNQLEKTKGKNVRKKSSVIVKKGLHSRKETPKKKDQETKPIEKTKPNSVHSMTRFLNAKHTKTSPDNSTRSVSSSASEPENLRSVIRKPLKQGNKTGRGRTGSAIQFNRKVSDDVSVVSRRGTLQPKRRAKSIDKLRIKHKRSINKTCACITLFKPTQRGKKTQDRKLHLKSVSNSVKMKNKTKATKTPNKMYRKMQAQYRSTSTSNASTNSQRPVAKKTHVHVKRREKGGTPKKRTKPIDRVGNHTSLENLSSSSSRNVVRISSTFDFNIEFYKQNNKEPPIFQPHEIPKKEKSSEYKLLSNENKVQTKRRDNRTSQYKIPSNESTLQRKRRDNLIGLNVTRSHYSQSHSSISEKSTTTKGLKNRLHKCTCLIKIGPNQQKTIKTKKKRTLASDQLHLQVLKSSATETENATFERYLQECEPGCLQSECDPYDCLKQMRRKKIKSRSTNTVLKRRSAGSSTFRRKNKSASSFTSRSAVFPKNKNVQSAAVIRKSKKTEHIYPKAVTSHPESRGRQAVRIGSSFNFSVEIFKDTTPIQPRYAVQQSRVAKWKPGVRQKASQGDGNLLHQTSRESQHSTRRIASKEKGSLVVPTLKRCFCTLKLLKNNHNKFNQNKANALPGRTESSVTRATGLNVKQHFKKYFRKNRRSKTAVPTVAVYRQQTYTLSRITLEDNKTPGNNTCLTIPHNPQSPVLQPGGFNMPRIRSTGSFSIGSITGYPLNELMNLKYFHNVNKTSICLLPKENNSRLSLASLKSYCSFSGSFSLNNNEICNPNKFPEKQSTNTIEHPFLKKCFCAIHFQVPDKGNSLNKQENDKLKSSNYEAAVPYNGSPSDCREVRLKKIMKTCSTISGNKIKQIPSKGISDFGVHIVQSTQICLQHSVFGVGPLSETQTVYRQSFENPYRKKRRRPKLFPSECEPGIRLPGECDDCLKLIKGRKTADAGCAQRSSAAMPYARRTEGQQICSLRKRNRGLYRRLYAKDEITNVNYFTSTSYSAKPPRQAVRIGSKFSFNIVFSKTTMSPQPVNTEYIEQNYEGEDYLKPDKIKKGKHRHSRNRHRGTQNVRNRRHKLSQSDQSFDTSSTMTNNLLKRCFCTAELQGLNISVQDTGSAVGTNTGMYRVPETRIMNESGTQSSTQVRKKPLRKKDLMNLRASGLDPNECEPGFCTPGYCDPYVCLKRIQERSTKVNTDSPRYKSTGSSSRFEKRRGRGQKIQTLRDGRDMMVETASGNLRHAQIQASKKDMVSYTPSGNIKAIHTTSQGTFAPGVEVRHGSSEMDKGRYQTKMTSAALPLVNKNISHEAGVTVNLSPDNNKFKNRQSKKTGDRKTGLGPLLKRCFCTLAFKKGNLEKYSKIHTSASTDTRENLQEPLDMYHAKNEQTNTSKKHFRAGQRLMPYECEPGVCTPGECDPYECLKRIEQRSYNSKNEQTNTTKKHFRGRQKLMPYECEPGVCTPGECDPYECLKRIERRSLYSRGTDPDRRHYRNRGSVSSQYSTASKGIKANKRPHQKHRNVGIGGRKQDFGTASSVNSMSKGTNARRRDRRHRFANTNEGIQASSISNRRAVRIGSNFSFNIDFYKDKGETRGGDGTRKLQTVSGDHHVMKYTKGMQSEGNDIRDGAYGERHLRDSFSQADYKTENKNVGTFLKRCFCTLNLQKNRARKQIQTKGPYGKYLRSANTQSNLEGHADNVSREITAGTRNQKYSLQPYECEPNVCIPGERDPYDCYERIQRRMRDQGVASDYIFREMGTETGNLNTIYTQPYECEPGTCVPGECDPYKCYQRLHKRRNVGTGGDRPSDMSVGTTAFNTNTSTASQFERRRRREEGIGTDGYGNREFGSSPRVNDFRKRRVHDSKDYKQPYKQDSNKQAVKISSSFSFNVEFFKDQGSEDLPKMQEPIRSKLRRDGRIRKTRAVRGGNRTKTDRGAGELMYGRDNESQMDYYNRVSSGSQHDSILKRCFCTLKLQQEQSHKRLIPQTRYPNDQKVYMVKTDTKTTSTKMKKVRQKLDPYECEPGFCIPGKCDPEVCLIRIKARNDRHATVGTLFKGDQSKNVKLQTTNVVEVPRYSNYFAKPRRVVRIGSSFQFKVEFLNDGPHMLDDQNDQISSKKKPSKFFKSSKNNQPLKLKKKDTIINTDDTFNNIIETADSKKAQNGKKETKNRKLNTDDSFSSKKLNKSSNQNTLHFNTNNNALQCNCNFKHSNISKKEEKLKKPSKLLPEKKSIHLPKKDEKKIQTDSKTFVKKSLIKRSKMIEKHTKSFKELNSNEECACSCVCSPVYCNTEARTKGYSTRLGDVADTTSGEALKRCFCTMKFQTISPKERKVITVGRVAIETTSNNYFQQPKDVKLTGLNKLLFSNEMVTILPYKSKMPKRASKMGLKFRESNHPCVQFDESELLNGNPESETYLRLNKTNDNDCNNLKYNNVKGNSLADVKKQIGSRGFKKTLQRFACFFSRQRLTSCSKSPIYDGRKYNGKRPKNNCQPQKIICAPSEISIIKKVDKTNGKSSRGKHHRQTQRQKHISYRYDDSPQLSNELKHTSKEPKHVLKNGCSSFNNKKTNAISPYARDYIVGHCMTKRDLKKKDSVHSCQSCTSINCYCKKNYSKINQNLKSNIKKKDKNRESATLRIVKPPPRTWDYQDNSQTGIRKIMNKIKCGQKNYDKDMPIPKKLKSKEKSAKRFKSDEPQGEWLANIQRDHNDCVDCVTCCEDSNANSPISMKLKSNKSIFKKKNVRKPLKSDRPELVNKISSECLRCPNCLNIIDANFPVLKGHEPHMDNKVKQLDCYMCCEEFVTNSLIPKKKSTKSIFKKKNVPNEPLKSERPELVNKISSECLRCPNCLNIIDANFPVLKGHEAYIPPHINNKVKQLDCYMCCEGFIANSLIPKVKSNKSTIPKNKVPKSIESDQIRGMLENCRCPYCQETLQANFVLKESKANKSNMTNKKKQLVSFSRCECKSNIPEPLKSAKQLDSFSRCECKLNTSIPTPTKSAKQSVRSVCCCKKKPLAPQVKSEKKKKYTKPKAKTRSEQNPLLELHIDKSNYIITNAAKFIKQFKDNPPEPCGIGIEEEMQLSEKLKKKFYKVMEHLKNLNVCKIQPNAFEVRVDSQDYSILNKEQTYQAFKRCKKKGRSSRGQEVSRRGQEVSSRGQEEPSPSPFSSKKKGSKFKTASAGKPCICKSRICDEEVRKMRRKQGLEHKFMKVPCVCGSRVCRSRALHAATRKRNQKLYGKGIPRTEYEQIMKYIHKNRRQPSCKIARDLLLGKHRSNKLNVCDISANKIDQWIDQWYENRRQKEISSKLATVARRRHRHYKQKMGDEDEMEAISGEAGLSASIMDLIQLSGTLTESAARLAYRTVMYPSRTCRKIKEAVTCKEKRTKSKTYLTANFVTKATMKRIGKRLFASTYFARFLRGMYTNRFTTMLVHMILPRGKRKPIAKKGDDAAFLQCSLFMNSLRRKPHMWVYECCPWFYPHCISMVTVWKQFTDLLLFLLAIVVWSPCIFCCEACRGLMCCSFCTA